VSRIIAGDAGSIRLHSVAKSTRPTGDRVKESTFAALEARGLVEDCVVLDLFAGTGALGLESLSRGATSVILVEKDPEAHEICLKHSVQGDLNYVTRDEVAALLHGAASGRVRR